MPIAPLRRAVAAFSAACVLSAAAPAALRAQAPPPGAARGTLIVLNKAEASASLIDLELGREVARVATGVGPHEVCVSPDGATAVVADYGEQTPGSTLTLFDVASTKRLKTIDLAPHRRPHGIAWLGEEARVVVTSETSKALLVVDLDAGKVDAVLSTGQEATHMVALAPRCDFACTANIGSGTITFLDLLSERSLGHVKTGAGCEGIDVTPDGAQVWTANRAADTVSVVDAITHAVVATLPCASFPIRAKVTPDGRRVLVSCAKSGDVALFDARERKLVARIKTTLAGAGADGSTLGGAFAGSSTPIGIQIHPDGRFAYVAHANADAIAILDLEQGQAVGTLAAGRGPDGLAWTAVRVDESARTAPPAPPDEAPAGGDGGTPTMAQAQRQLAQRDWAGAAQLFEAITAAQPKNAQAWHLWGYAVHAQGDFARALELHLAAAKFPATAGSSLYNAGCACARLGDAERAFQYLGQAEATGTIDLAQMRGDEDLVALRDDPRFHDLMPPKASFADPFVEPARVVRVFDGDAALGQFGWVARAVGDVDGDGALDFVTSQPTLASGGPAAGRISLLSSRSGKELWRRHGQPGDQLGLSVEAAGDVDGDRVPDVIAGAPGRGVALLCSGKDGAVLRTLSGSAAETYGREVADFGDLDGDGHADVIVGAPAGGANGAGRIEVVSGATGEVLLALQGARSGDRFGIACAGWCDEDEALLVVGAPDAGEQRRGRVVVFDARGDERFAIEPAASGAELGGMFVSVVGDVDGDGYPDVYASDWNDSARGPSTGRVYVHSGETGERLLELSGESAGEGFGIGVADAGDVDGDGCADLVIGSWQHSGGARAGGRCTLFSGRDGAVLRTLTCKVPGDTFGFDATGIGDVDADGRPDLLLTSAWSRVNGTRSGRIFIVAGEAPAR